MSVKSKIEWTGATWNPVRGCTKVSPGCKNCYAEDFSERFRGVEGHPFGQGFDLRLVPEKLQEPLKWRKPIQILVNSMSDLFHEGISDEYIISVAKVMMEAKQHTYQVLTKRAVRMRNLLNTKLQFAAHSPHILWGVSAEDKKYGVPRIEHLRRADVAVRFVSVEPLLEDIGEVDLSNIDWVIIGGESGVHARPFDLDWARSIIRQCSDQRLECFMKQVGRRPVENGKTLKLANRKGGDWNEWPGDLRVRQYPNLADSRLSQEPRSGLNGASK
jgi:protein gp37